MARRVELLKPSRRRKRNQAMRKLPRNGARGRPWSPARRHHAWLATWLQDRRRGRIAASVPGLVTLTTGLVGYYNLDEAGDYDDAIDYAGNMGGMASTGGALVSTSGPGLHLARDFSDAGSLTQLVDFAGFSGPPFTINFWIFQNSNGGQYVFDCSGAMSQGFSCFLATDAPYVNLYAFTPEYDSPGTIGTSGNFGSWVMFTLVWNGAEYSYYENGVLIGSDAFVLADAFATAVAPFQISAWFLPVDGAMALFGVWQRELTALEVTQLYNGGDGHS